MLLPHAHLLLLLHVHLLLQRADPLVLHAELLLRAGLLTKLRNSLLLLYCT